MTSPQNNRQQMLTALDDMIEDVVKRGILPSSRQLEKILVDTRAYIADTAWQEGVGNYQLSPTAIKGAYHFRKTA